MQPNQLLLHIGFPHRRILIPQFPGILLTPFLNYPLSGQIFLSGPLLSAELDCGQIIYSQTFYHIPHRVMLKTGNQNLPADGFL